MEAGRQPKIKRDDSDETLDFYPVAMSVIVPVTVPVQTELCCRYQMTAMEAVKAEAALKVQAGVEKTVKAEQRASFQMAASELAQAALSGSCFKMMAEESIETEAALNICTGSGRECENGTEADLSSGAEISVLQTEAFMYKKNLLNGSWKLNGIRRLWTAVGIICKRLRPGKDKNMASNKGVITETGRKNFVWLTQGMAVFPKSPRWYGETASVDEKGAPKSTTGTEVSLYNKLLEKAVEGHSYVNEKKTTCRYKATLLEKES